MDRESLVKELEYLNRDGDEEQNLVNECVLDVYDTLYGQGHSGFSYSYVSDLIKKLVLDNGIIKPIMPYEDDPSDWQDTFHAEHRIYQNKRRSSVFYDADTNRYDDVDKVMCSDNNGELWFTSGGWYNTFRAIKVPYVPDGKRWYIYTELLVELEPGFGADEGDYVITKVEYR